ncbi:ParA family protein [Johnsonella ignava]|uniref:ParA family protein n=1 Tax=Johnsonella ignava TaxID=43995 RepID=UPI0023F4DE82|nr:ParA family protein [Johnsonella ignava]
MKEKPTIIAVVNQKGGTAKTTTVENLGIGLAREGKKVLLVDTDPQGSLTISLGYPRPDELEVTLFDLLNKTINEDIVTAGEGILHQAEGIDLVPANISLAGLEVALVNTMNRERILKQFLEPVKAKYDYVLLDCMPSLGMLTVNALAAADAALVPVQANYLSAKGLEQLLQTINKVKRQINPKLRIEGILLTMVDGRTNYGREISSLIRDTYGGHIKIFNSEIPRSARAAEISAEGKSIFLHDPKGKVAEAYQNLTKEVMTNAEKRRKHQLEQLR